LISSPRIITIENLVTDVLTKTRLVVYWMISNEDMLIVVIIIADLLGKLLFVVHDSILSFYYVVPWHWYICDYLYMYQIELDMCFF